MIPPDFVVALIGMITILIVYTFYDSENKLYGNIVSCAICWILSAVMAMIMLGGQVVDFATDITVESAGLGYFFAIIALIMFIYNVLLIIDVVFGVEGYHGPA